jgi:arginine deiminase
MPMTDSGTFGVYSEVGKLRKVIVHRPDLSLCRLTPSNHDELLFDDVLWVERAQKEHDAFVQILRSHGAEVFYVHELLAEALAASDKARVQVIDAVANESTVGWSIVDETREMLEKLPPALLAKHLIWGPDDQRARPGLGTAKSDLAAGGSERGRGPVRTAASTEHPVHPRLFGEDIQRCDHKPHVWPARRRESLNLLTIYRYHPMFQQAPWQEWYPGRTGDDDTLRLELFGAASMEGVTSSESGTRPS